MASAYVMVGNGVAMGPFSSGHECWIKPSTNDTMPALSTKDISMSTWRGAEAAVTCMKPEWDRQVGRTTLDMDVRVLDLETSSSPCGTVQNAVNSSIKRLNDGQRQKRQTHLCELWLSVWFGSFISVAASHLEVPATVSDKAEANCSELLMHNRRAGRHQSLSQSNSCFCFAYSFTWSLVQVMLTELAFNLLCTFLNYYNATWRTKRCWMMKFCAELTRKKQLETDHHYKWHHYNELTTMVISWTSRPETNQI